MIIIVTIRSTSILVWANGYIFMLLSQHLFHFSGLHLCLFYLINLKNIGFIYDENLRFFELKYHSWVLYELSSLHGFTLVVY